MQSLPTSPLVLPDGQPFLLSGGSVGCLLIHGFTSMPGEMRWLGDDLARRGYTVLGVRLAGHGTRPQDLARVQWADWLGSVEDGLALLAGVTERVVLIGQSLGGDVALLAGARYPVQAVVTMAAPYRRPDRRALLWHWLTHRLQPWLSKGVAADPTWGERREAGYPAYAALPTRVFLEVAALQRAMRRELANIGVPVLLIHSQDDPGVPAGDMRLIYNRLTMPCRQMLYLDGYGHGMVRAEGRDELFGIIARFVAKVGGC